MLQTGRFKKVKLTLFLARISCTQRIDTWRAVATYIVTYSAACHDVSACMLSADTSVSSAKRLNRSRDVLWGAFSSGPMEPRIKWGHFMCPTPALNVGGASSFAQPGVMSTHAEVGRCRLSLPTL